MASPISLKKPNSICAHLLSRSYSLVLLHLVTHDSDYADHHGLNDASYFVLHMITSLLSVPLFLTMFSRLTFRRLPLSLPLPLSLLPLLRSESIPWITYAQPPLHDYQFINNMRQTLHEFLQHNCHLHLTFRFVVSVPSLTIDMRFRFFYRSSKTFSGNPSSTTHRFVHCPETLKKPPHSNNFSLISSLFFCLSIEIYRTGAFFYSKK